MPCELMHQALVATMPLPWETGSEGAEARRRQLGTLRRLVMPCLERKHEDRPDAGYLLQGWYHLCDVYAMHAPQQRRAPVPVAITRGPHNTFNTFNTVSSARGGATASTVFDRTEVAVAAAAPTELSSPPAVTAPLEDSTAIIDSAAFDVADLHTAQQSSASVPLDDGTADMMLPTPPPVATPRVEAKPDAKTEAHSAGRAAIRKWAEASAQLFQGHSGAGGSPARRVQRRLSSIRGINESGSVTDDHQGAEGEHVIWRSGTASGSIPVGSVVGDGSVTVMGAISGGLRASPDTSTDATRDERGSDARTKTTGTPAGTPAASVEMSSVRASSPVLSEGEHAHSETAASPMRLR